MFATFNYFGHKISIQSARHARSSHSYINVRGRSEESICQLLRTISGDVHNLNKLRSYVVPHLADNFRLNHLRDQHVLEQICRLIKTGSIKMLVQVNNPARQTIHGFPIQHVSDNVQEARRQEIELLQSRSMAAGTKPATPEPLPPPSSQPAETPSQLANPAPAPVTPVVPATEPEAIEVEQVGSPPSPAMLIVAAKDGAPFCEECERAKQTAAAS